MLQCCCNVLQSHHPYGRGLKKRCRCSRGEIWRDMARHGETIEFIQSLCRWRLADRAEGGAMVAAGC